MTKRIDGFTERGITSLQGLERELLRLEAEVKWRQAQLESARITLNKAADQIVELRSESERLRTGIVLIRDSSGAACRELEVCSHKGCNGSVSAHLIALELLRTTH